MAWRGPGALTMPYDFSLLSMTELRNAPGEVLDRVAEHGEAFIIERGGSRKACLVPLSAFFPDISPTRIAADLQELIDHDERPRPTITDDREIAIRLNGAAGGQPGVELRVILPHGYPNTCPRVYANLFSDDVPHRWKDGALCLYGVMTGWNPGKHTILTTLTLARVWLKRYNVWRDTGEWPSQKDDSNE